MTDQQHPITPPPELRQLWAQQAQRKNPRDPVAWQEHVATQAARWGADQELEACCEFLDDNELCDPNFHKDLRAVRRPNPPSLKELAELALSELNLTADPGGAELSRTQVELIRNALETFLND